ncbi:MAG: HAD-IC family P-type ATPase [Actinomycetota bacterium]
MLLAVDNKAIGIIAVADTLKEHSAEAVEELHKMGIEVAMLTGDNERTAKAIAKRLGIDEVLPKDKAEEIKRLFAIPDCKKIFEQNPEKYIKEEKGCCH